MSKKKQSPKKQAKSKSAPKPKAKKKAVAKKAPAKKRGRPTRYNNEYVDQALELALLGLTDLEMAKVFRVTEKTFNNWKNKHPEFLQALKDGKDNADLEIIKKLHKRASGYTLPEEKVFCNQGKIVRATTARHYPPDTAAAIFWLKNRQSQKWRDKHDVNLGMEKEAIENILKLFPEEYAEAIRAELEKLKK